MGVLEFLPATRKALRMLAAEPDEFAEEYGVRLHEVAQGVAQSSLEFMRTFSLETPSHWFGHFAIEAESQEMVGVCTLKGPPDGGTVEMAYYTFPGFEERGIATAMARFVLERARVLPGVKVVMARTPPGFDGAARVAEKIGMRFVDEEVEEESVMWRWEIEV
jgi:RimJ/RimL family protein N-acetyltransferase